MRRLQAVSAAAPKVNVDEMATRQAKSVASRRRSTLFGLIWLSMIHVVMGWLGQTYSKSFICMHVVVFAVETCKCGHDVDEKNPASKKCTEFLCSCKDHCKTATRAGTANLICLFHFTGMSCQLAR